VFTGSRKTLDQKNTFPAEKELQYFAENCSILQKNVVILHLL
jgi:hypothetical protein